MFIRTDFDWWQFVNVHIGNLRVTVVTVGSSSIRFDSVGECIQFFLIVALNIHSFIQSNRHSTKINFQNINITASRGVRWIPYADPNKWILARNTFWHEQFKTIARSAHTVSRFMSIDTKINGHTTPMPYANAHRDNTLRGKYHRAFVFRLLGFVEITASTEPAVACVWSFFFNLAQKTVHFSQMWQTNQNEFQRPRAQYSLAHWFIDNQANRAQLIQSTHSLFRAGWESDDKPNLKGART